MKTAADKTKETENSCNFVEILGARSAKSAEKLATNLKKIFQIKRKHCKN